jgi:hypothetical protein
VIDCEFVKAGIIDPLKERFPRPFQNDSHDHAPCRNDGHRAVVGNDSHDAFLLTPTAPCDPLRRDGGFHNRSSSIVVAT